MVLEPALASIAERLIAASRAGRAETIRHDLRRREADAARRGTLGAGFYAQDQIETCLTELNRRAGETWLAYRRVLAEARTPWSPELRDEILRRIEGDLLVDAEMLEETARS